MPVTKSGERTVSAVTTAGEMAMLRAPWTDLLARSATQSGFLTWEWLATWQEVYGGDVEPCILLVRDEATLVGIAPFAVRRERLHGVIPTRTLRFLGTGEPEWEEVASVYLDLIAAPGHEGAVAASIWEYLAGGHVPWDRIAFDDVLGDSVLLDHLAPLVEESGSPSAVREDALSFFIELPETSAEYMRRLGRRTRKRIVNNRGHFERAGKLEERVVRDEADLEEAFRTLVTLHGSRWRTKGEAGVFASPRFTEFHRRVTRRLLERGELDLRSVILDGTPIAALYNIRFKDTVISYQGGFDFDRWSAGTLSDVLGIEGAIREGVRHYDFLKGARDSYKSGLGTTTRPLHTMRVYARTLAGRLLAAEDGARRLLGRPR